MKKGRHFLRNSASLKRTQILNLSLKILPTFFAVFFVFVLSVLSVQSNSELVTNTTTNYYTNNSSTVEGTSTSLSQVMEVDRRSKYLASNSSYCYPSKIRCNHRCYTPAKLTSDSKLQSCMACSFFDESERMFVDVSNDDLCCVMTKMRCFYSPQKRGSVFPIFTSRSYSTNTNKHEMINATDKKSFGKSNSSEVNKPNQHQQGNPPDLDDFNNIISNNVTTIKVPVLDSDFDSNSNSDSGIDPEKNIVSEQEQAVNHDPLEMPFRKTSNRKKIPGIQLTNEISSGEKIEKTTAKPNIRIAVYAYNNFGVPSEIFELQTSKCKTLPTDWQKRISSLNTYGNCVEVCQYKNCTGRCIRVAPGSPGHNRLRQINFDKRISSIRPCPPS